MEVWQQSCFDRILPAFSGKYEDKCGGLERNSGICHKTQIDDEMDRGIA